MYSRMLKQPCAKNTIQYASITLVLLFPMLSVLAGSSASAFLGLIVLLAPVAAFLASGNSAITRTHKWIAIVFAINVIFALTVFFIKGYNYQGWKELGRLARLLLVFPALLFFIHAKPPVKFFWAGVCLASAGAGATAIYETLWQGAPRASAGINPILFGDISLMYSSFSGIAAVFYYQKNNRVLCFMAVLASGLGMFAVVASGTRGAWLAIPFVSLLLLYFVWGMLPPKFKLTLFLAPLLLLIVAFCTPMLKVESRINSLVGEFNQLNSSASMGSIGQRVEMWRASKDAWLDAPVLGQGQGGYVAYVGQGIVKGEYSKSIEKYSHSHNDYLFALASRGLIGLCLLLLMYVLLLNHARRSVLAHAESAPYNLSAVALLVLVACYALFGLTEAIMIRSQALSIFVVLVGILLANIEREKTLDTQCIGRH